jgi:hypothetical protein
MLSNIPSQIQQEIEFIRPMVEERFAKMRSMEKTGTKNRFVRPLSYLVFHYIADFDLQIDMLMWLMSEAKGVERSFEGLAPAIALSQFCRYLI